MWGPETRLQWQLWHRPDSLPPQSPPASDHSPYTPQTLPVAEDKTSALSPTQYVHEVMNFITYFPISFKGWSICILQKQVVATQYQGGRESGAGAVAGSSLPLAFSTAWGPRVGRQASARCENVCHSWFGLGLTYQKCQPAKTCQRNQTHVTKCMRMQYIFAPRVPDS